MNRGPVTQVTDQHHADEAAHQRRAEALTQEVYANLPAYLDEIIEFTDMEAVVRQLLTASIGNRQQPHAVKLENVNRVADAAIFNAVEKIVDRQLENQP